MTVCFCSLFFHPYFRNSLKLIIGLQAILAMSSTDSTGVGLLQTWLIHKINSFFKTILDHVQDLRDIRITSFFFHQRLLTPGIFFSSSLNRMNPYQPEELHNFWWGVLVPLLWPSNSTIWKNFQTIAGASPERKPEKLLVQNLGITN